MKAEIIIAKGIGDITAIDNYKQQAEQRLKEKTE